MSDFPAPPLQNCRLTIIAQDPGVRVMQNGESRILRATVEIPAEYVTQGPCGYRVQVIDYDASTGTYYQPAACSVVRGALVDPYAAEAEDAARGRSDAELVSDRGFHAQNVYALSMRTLARFERALGRRIRWGFHHHQLKVAPQAFYEANAYYARDLEALLFGYFPTADGQDTVYTCLAHDVVVHETTHALLDGLRGRFMEPSSPDQAAFHEAFADIVALLSVFSLPEVVGALLRRESAGDDGENLISEELLTAPRLRESALLRLAEQMGAEMSGGRDDALRKSAQLVPSREYLASAEFRPAHRRGEVLVAATLNTFLELWVRRIDGLRRVGRGKLDLERVVQEGAEAADYLMTMAIRALDYLPPIHLEFSDFLSAMITADYEIRPDDSRYQYRDKLRESFAAYGIEPVDARAAKAGRVLSPVPTKGEEDERHGAAPRERSASGRRSGRARGGGAAGSAAAAGAVPEPGMFLYCEDLPLTYSRTHFDSMLRDPEEVFRFIWENRDVLRISTEVFSEVQSVRPCLRVGPDGFILHETVAEFVQQIRLKAEELKSFGEGIAKPEWMPDSHEVRLFGGGTLIFDEYGRLKYFLHNSIDNPVRQAARLAYLWPAGAFDRGVTSLTQLSRMHLLKAVDAVRDVEEEW
jgi:hypothetical protein